MTDRKQRVAVLCSRPTQTTSPLFSALERRCELHVCYLFDAGAYFDAGFMRWVGADLAPGADETNSVILGPPPASGTSRAWSPYRRLVGKPRPGRLSPWESAKRVRPLYQWLQDTSPDALVVHGYDEPLMMVALILCRVLGIPTFMRGTSLAVSSGPTLVRALRHARARLAVGLATHAASMGCHNDEFYRSMGMSDNHVYRVPYAGDSELIRTGLSRDDADEDVSLQRNLHARPTVLFLGKLQPWKRPLDLLLAAQRLAVPPRLVFAGSGPLLTAIERAGYPGPLELLGFVPRSELPALLATSDVLALPSEVESWGLVVNEALYAGVVPVVAETVGCAPDLVSGVGEVFPTGNIAAFAHSLDTVLHSLPARRQAALERATHWDIEASASALEAAVRDCGRTHKRRYRHSR